MNKMNFFGVGPKIAIVLLPWLGSSIVLSSFNIRVFKYTLEPSGYMITAGILLAALGLVLYFSSLRMLLIGLRGTKLVTKGIYSICQNPLYSSIILIIIPALSLLMNSWLVLTSCLVGYILFKLHIKNEYKELEEFFGEEYLEYKAQTPEFFPLPTKK